MRKLVLSQDCRAYLKPMRSLRFLTGIVFAMLVMMSTWPGSAQDARRFMPEVKGIRTEILALPALRTQGTESQQRQMAAWDSEPLMAVFYTPEAGDNMFGPAIVFMDEGPGKHPLPQSSASRFAAERLAAKGYSVLSLFSRINRGYENIPFESSALDTKAAIDYLEAKGHEDIILAGHGFGSVAISYYIATQPDDALDAPRQKRVKATVHFAPPADEQYIGSSSESAYAVNVKAAQDAVAQAKANPPAQRPPGTPAPPRTYIVQRPGMAQSPEMFLNYWGPEANTRLSVLFGRLPRMSAPILLLAGGNDPTVPKGWLEALQRAVNMVAKVDIITYPNGNHAFEGLWDKAAGDVAAWLTAQGLGVRPRVKIEIVDARSESGEIMAGVLYKPESGDFTNRPAFILQFGTGGDVLHSATQWLGWRLAQAGYAVLSPRSRMSGNVGLEVSNYAESVSDLGKWMDFLESRGLKRVIMEGHSLGGILVSNYAARMQDPRVIGLVYMAPTRDSPINVRASLGPDYKTREEVYARVSKEADEAVARGEGHTHIVQYGNASSFAAHWVDKRGPKAPLHTDVVKAIKVPSLSFAGTEDGLMTRSFIAQFTTLYGGKAEAVWIQNGTHNGRESKNLYRDEIIAWIKRNGFDHD